MRTRGYQENKGQVKVHVGGGAVPHPSMACYREIFSTLPSILPFTRGNTVLSSEISSNISVLISGQKLLKKNLKRATERGARLVPALHVISCLVHTKQILGKNANTCAHSSSCYTAIRHCMQCWVPGELVGGEICHSLTKLPPTPSWELKIKSSYLLP